MPGADEHDVLSFDRVRLLTYSEAARRRGATGEVASSVAPDNALGDRRARSAEGVDP